MLNLMMISFMIRWLHNLDEFHALVTNNPRETKRQETEDRQDRDRSDRDRCKYALFETRNLQQGLFSHTVFLVLHILYKTLACMILLPMYKTAVWVFYKYKIAVREKADPAHSSTSPAERLSELLLSSPPSLPSSFLFYPSLVGTIGVSIALSFTIF